MMVFLKKLHKWVGLVIGIQVLLWLLSGLMLSLLDPEKVNYIVNPEFRMTSSTAGRPNTKEDSVDYTT